MFNQSDSVEGYTLSETTEWQKRNPQESNRTHKAQENRGNDMFDPWPFKASVQETNNNGMV